jgi:tetratricopeptide (TPR) repeat protein
VIGASAGEHEALQLFRQVGHRIGEMVCLVHLGLIAIYAGNDTQAREHLEQGLSIAREIKHQEGEATAELALGETAFEAGDQPRAFVRFQRSLAVCKSGGDKRGEASATFWLGRLDLQGDNLESARGRLSDALRAFRTFEMRNELLSCLEDHAVLAARSDALERAVKLAAATTSLRSRLALKRSPRHEQRWEAQVARIKEAVGPDALPMLWVEGEMWDVENAMSSALAAH